MVTQPLIEQAERDAEVAPGPGTLEVGEIVGQATGELPESRVSRVADAGYVYVYNTRTGEQIPVNRNMLKIQLGKRFEDGRRELAFTTVDPGIKPFRGSIKCDLHASDPRRVYFDSLGFPTCEQESLPSAYQKGLHMKHRHPTVWATLEQQRLEDEKAEERRFQRSLLKAATGGRKRKGKPEEE